LYVTLSESIADLMNTARTHHIDLAGIQFVEVRPSEQDLKPEGQYSVFHPAEIELTERLQMIVTEITRHKPDRLVIDALSEVRMLAKDPLHFRRQVISLRETTPQPCTVLLLDDRTSRDSELELHSIVHGVVTLNKVHVSMERRVGAWRFQSSGVVLFARAITTTSSGPVVF
jgi:circadian clock protein KaiC